MRVSPILLAAAAAATSHAARYPVPPATGNLEPVIGVLTVSLDSVNEPCLTAEQREARLLAGVAGDDVDSCFAAFYIKWLEASGARVVIIPYTANQTTCVRHSAARGGMLCVHSAFGGSHTPTTNSPVVAGSTACWRA